MKAVNVVSNSCSIVPAHILIHCQPDSHETPPPTPQLPPPPLHTMFFCISRSPFTSFPAIVFPSSGQQSQACINGRAAYSHLNPPDPPGPPPTSTAPPERSGSLLLRRLFDIELQCQLHCLFSIAHLNTRGRSVKNKRLAQNCM